MEKFVIVNYPASRATSLKVNYSIQLSGKLQTIECHVDDKQPLPKWLQLHRFNFVSLKSQNTYSLLFEESKYNKNLDTLLFMDEVYASIMEQRNFQVA
ncbi:hypothetical protein G5B30_06180 [Sphingobacterium sp. SGG-5]|uniref:hypothetical protein n=1 Tax=Sphingobacterium sp. SGG-5 TaxID=2710881 RepID=UPI0013EABC6F|nr:hypothetical protein [Sphingobacterium sp. SGG-5]NGM61506.1 hypothetical protein [Sphingobacterium sp. SGG-5]